MRVAHFSESSAGPAACGATGPMGHYRSVGWEPDLLSALITCPACLAKRPGCDLPGCVPSICSSSFHAVQVGDVIRDPALLVEGMRCEWVDGGGGGFSRFPWVRSDDPLDEGVLDRTRDVGVRVLALPGEVAVKVDVTGQQAGTMRMEIGVAPPPPPPKCPPTCVPAAPCMSHHTCPGQREALIARNKWSGDQWGEPTWMHLERREPQERLADLRCEQNWACGLVRGTR